MQLKFHKRYDWFGLGQIVSGDDSSHESVIGWAEIVTNGTALPLMLPVLPVLRPALSESELIAKCSWQIVQRLRDVSPPNVLDGRPNRRRIPLLECYFLTYLLQSTPYYRHFERLSNIYPQHSCRLFSRLTRVYHQLHSGDR